MTHGLAVRPAFAALAAAAFFMPANAPAQPSPRLRDSDDWICNHAPPGPRREAACARLHAYEPEEEPERRRPADERRRPPYHQPGIFYPPGEQPPPTPPVHQPAPVRRTPPVRTPPAHTPPHAASPPPRSPPPAPTVHASLYRRVACLTYEAVAIQVVQSVQRAGRPGPALQDILGQARGPRAALFTSPQTPEPVLRSMVQAAAAWRGPGAFPAHAYAVCLAGSRL